MRGVESIEGLRSLSLPARTRLVIGLTLIYFTSALVRGAELDPRTRQAYEAYVDEARRAFLQLVASDEERWARDDTARAEIKSGSIVAGPARKEPISKVPGGLVHHWAGAALLPHTTLDRVIELSEKYDDYPAIYKSVKSSRILARDGDSFRAQFRIEEHASVISATLDVWSTIRYVRVSRTRAYSVSDATEVREVADAGKPTEHVVPADEARGYLWRAAAFTKLVERDGAVYVEVETIALSRGYPTLLAWIIEPIGRRLGRKSVEVSISEFRDALRRPS